MINLEAGIINTHNNIERRTGMDRLRSSVSARIAGAALSFASIATVVEASPVANMIPGIEPSAANAREVTEEELFENYCDYVQVWNGYYLYDYFDSTDEMISHYHAQTPEYREFQQRVVYLDRGEEEPDEVISGGGIALVFYDDEHAADILVRDEVGSVLSDVTIEEPASCYVPFKDIDHSFAKDDIIEIYERGITTGTTETTFSPKDTVTREQMAAFLGRTYYNLGGTKPTTDGIPFNDVDPDSFAKDYINDIYNLGITEGTSSATYSPEDNVTREQMAAFLARTYKVLGGEIPAVGGESPFIDLSASSYALSDVALLFELGITTGTSETTYSPEDNVTREQMAAFLHRLIIVIERQNKTD